jgi:hypothetical protein
MRIVTSSCAGSIQKIVPAVPSQPYSPACDGYGSAPGSRTTFTFARPHPIFPPRARRIGSGKVGPAASPVPVVCLYERFENSKQKLAPCVSRSCCIATTNARREVTSGVR